MLNAIQWGEIKKSVTTGTKKPVWYREWAIPKDYTSGFFIFWNANKFKMKSAGYSVYKTLSGGWVIRETKKNNGEFDSIVTNVQLPPKSSSVELKKYSIIQSSGLLPWQIPSVEKLCSVIKTIGAALDGSDLGLGKTFCAVAVARELKMKILVVCPLNVQEPWRKVIVDHFKMEDSLVGIINYEKLIRGRKDSSVASYIRNRETRTEKFTWKIPKNTLIIWDEAQKLKNWKTQNSKACREAYKQGFKMLFCSASIATNPLELRTVGMCLKMFSGTKQYYDWAYRHGVVMGRFGLEFKEDAAALKRLHKDLFEYRGSRLSREMVPNFPESELKAECYTLDEENTKLIDKTYRDLAMELKRLERKVKGEKSNNALTAILRAREKTELLKIPVFSELVEQGLSAGMSVVVFLNFVASVDALANKFDTTCIIDGRNKGNERQLFIDNFQNDEQRLIIVNMQSGGAGISLHDINGKYPRLSLISPSFSAILTRQATGRVWRTGAKSKSVQKIIFIANTVEEDVCESVKRKLNNMDLLNDGDLLPSNTIITEDMGTL